MSETINPVRIINLLEKVYGRESWNWHTKQNPFQVLIGTVLSQRTRDDNTDRAAKALFSRYHSPESLARAPLESIEPLIRPANYYKTKAKKIREISRIITERHNGKVPYKTEQLVRLPGVGMKTASCTMLYGHKISRIPCDVHVMVISQRLGWTDKKNPDEIQDDLERKLPKAHWHRINDLFVKHGQSTCLTRNPRCGACPITRYCRYHDKDMNAPDASV